jgi:hypothetical protein
LTKVLVEDFFFKGMERIRVRAILPSPAFLVKPYRKHGRWRENKLEKE